MQDFLILAIKIHLILSFSLIVTLFYLGISKLGFKKFFRDLKKDSNLWYVLILFLTSPYQVVLVGVAKVGKETSVILDKLKKITIEDRGNNG